MKEHKLASVIRQLNALLLTANAIVCESGVMENAERKLGFKLSREPDARLKSGFHYVARFKHPIHDWKVKIIKTTNTDNREEAIAFAVENREAIINEYDKRKEQREKARKNDGNDFFAMLAEYFQKDSKYLQDDKIRTGSDITFKQRLQYLNAMERLIIPFLRDKEVKNMGEVSAGIYDELKLFLQGQTSKKGGTLSKKTCNTYLQGFVRIIQYHKRKRLITEFPYEPGEALIMLAKEDKGKNKPGILPTDYLPGIFKSSVFVGTAGDEKDLFLADVVSMLGLTCGMRNSEIARLKRKDIRRYKDVEGYYLFVWNHKTEAHNQTEGEEYRKIPIHPFIVDCLRKYIKYFGKEADDYLFGEPRADKDTGEIDGFLKQGKFENAINYLYQQIAFRMEAQKTGGLESALEAVEKGEWKNEMREKRITFYSLRHTFETLFVMKYPGQQLLIDYFMGHKPQQAMLANYLHINQAGDITFWNDYGKYFMDYQRIFMPPEEISINDRERAKEDFAKIEHLLKRNADGTILIDNNAIHTMGEMIMKRTLKNQAPVPTEERDYL